MRVPLHCFSVLLHDVDGSGVLFFSHLFRHAHDAYESLMEDLGFPLSTLIAKGFRLPLVHASADYLQPVRHGDVITVEIEVKNIGRSSFALGYRFADAAEEIRARADTVHVHSDSASGKSASLPSVLAEALADYRLEAATSLRCARSR